MSVCGGKRETELFFYSLPVKTNHHPYWIKSGVVKIFPPVFGLLFYEQERLTGGVFRYVLIRFYNTFKENLFCWDCLVLFSCWAFSWYWFVFINQRLSKLESFIDKWREGKEIWIKAYLQLIHNTLGITETEKLVNLYNSFLLIKWLSGMNQ